MAFLKIGNMFVNLDRVTVVRDLSTRNAAGQIARPFYRLEFDGRQAVEIADDAASLQAWLLDSRNVVTPAP